MIYTAKSTFMGLVIRGMFWDTFTPWKILVDITKKRITITKRNWYFISVDEDVFAFSSVRHITIDKFLFGADLHVRMFGGSASVYAISKKSAKEIRDILLDGVNNNSQTEIYIDNHN